MGIEGEVIKARKLWSECSSSGTDRNIDKRMNSKGKMGGRRFMEGEKVSSRSRRSRNVLEFRLSFGDGR